MLCEASRVCFLRLFPRKKGQKHISRLPLVMSPKDICLCAVIKANKVFSIHGFLKNHSLNSRDSCAKTVQEYNAQSRGEIEIIIPEMDKGYVSKTLETAMREFKNKVAQCMTHQREIINLDDDEKVRLNRIMTKFIEDFKKDKKWYMNFLKM